MGVASHSVGYDAGRQLWYFAQLRPDRSPRATADPYHPVEPGRFGLLVREYESFSADYTAILPGGEALPFQGLAPGRLIYAGTGRG